MTSYHRDRRDRSRVGSLLPRSSARLCPRVPPPEREPLLTKIAPVPAQYPEASVHPHRGGCCRRSRRGLAAAFSLRSVRASRAMARASALCMGLLVMRGIVGSSARVRSTTGKSVNRSRVTRLRVGEARAVSSEIGISIRGIGHAAVLFDSRHWALRLSGRPQFAKRRPRVFPRRRSRLDGLKSRSGHRARRGLHPRASLMRLPVR